MAEKSRRLSLFRFRFPFRSSPAPVAPPGRPRPLPQQATSQNGIQEPTSQKQPMPVPSQPPSAIPPKIHVQEDELSSASSYKDFAGQTDDPVKEKSITEISTKPQINLSTNQEEPISPAKKVPEEIEVTKEVVNLKGKSRESEKEEQRDDGINADVQVVDMLSAPAEYTIIEEKESKPTGTIKDEQSNIILADQQSESNHARTRESFERTLNSGQQQNPSSDSSKQASLNLITLAGQNNGATMSIAASGKQAKEEQVAIQRGYKLNEEDKKDIEPKNLESNNQSNKRISEYTEMIHGTFANSNSQSINNSILHNSSCSERSPGVHFEFFKGLPAQSENLEQKQANNDHVLHQQTPQTRIRRQCLQSLFMDSDTENVHKPHYHGCP